MKPQVSTMYLAHYVLRAAAVLSLAISAHAQQGELGFSVESAYFLFSV